MVIEIFPSQTSDSDLVLFTATFFHESRPVAEIKDAPHDIATRWAEVMKEVHDGYPEIRQMGMCQYCGHTESDGSLCVACNRVFQRR